MLKTNTHEYGNIFKPAKRSSSFSFHRAIYGFTGGLNVFLGSNLQMLMIIALEK